MYPVLTNGWIGVNLHTTKGGIYMVMQISGSWLMWLIRFVSTDALFFIGIKKSTQWMYTFPLQWCHIHFYLIQAPGLFPLIQFMAYWSFLQQPRTHQIHINSLYAVLDLLLLLWYPSPEVNFKHSPSRVFWRREIVSQGIISMTWN